jgi:hypothetical protein
VSKPFAPSSTATSSPGNGAVRAEPAPAPRTSFGEPDPSAHVTVMFSGGSDSTLTASMFAEKYAHVHLLTYQHAAMSFEEKCVKSLERLQKAHGMDRFTHKFIDINPLMGRMFVKPLAKDLREYGTYALPMCCGACKLSMHVQTILYNRARKIEYAADGSNVELSELFPEQMPEVLELYRLLYERYGIRYSNPVFNVNRSDHVLFDRGVTQQREVKNQHLVYTNQHSCMAGAMLYGYTLGVGIPLLGRSADRSVAEKYIRAKIEDHCVPFLDQELASCPAAD